MMRLANWRGNQPVDHPEDQAVTVEGQGTQQDPVSGIALDPKSPAVSPQKTQYTCPMHPEIVQDEPGDCPICGMALEPVTVTLAEEKNPELVDMTRRFWVSAALTAPVLLLAMGGMVGLTFDWLASHRVLTWLEMAFATPVVLWGGWPFFVRGWQSVCARLAVGGQSQPQHVHFDRLRYRGCLRLQCRGDDGAGNVPGVLSGCCGPSSRVLRSGRRHRDVGVARTGHGTARP
jgi:hypothetical protein